MMRRHRLALIASLAFWGVLPGSVLAQDETGFVADLDWQHPYLDFKFPTEIDGAKRGQLNRYRDEDVDNSAHYRDDETQTTFTIYVYRTGLANLPVWADRAATAMLMSDTFKPDADQVLIENISTGTASEVADGQLITARATAAPFQSTGLIMFASDDWLFKVRASSSALDYQQLADRMKAFLAAARFPAPQRPSPEFVGMENCEESMTFKKRARLVRMDMVSRILIGTALSAALEKAQEDDDSAEAATFCRDGASDAQIGVYQSVENSSYILALGDSGRTIEAARVDMGGLVKPSRQFIVSSSDGVSRRTYPPFDRLPSPREAYAATDQLSPIHETRQLPGEDAETTIIVPGGSE